MSTGKRRFKIELEDAEGSKYNVSLEGNVSKDKIAKIIEFMDLLNLESDTSLMRQFQNTKPPASVGDRIWDLVDTKFPYGNFTSSDILEIYEDSYNEPIKLSIISTYLSRYSDRGRLTRTRQGKEWVYRHTRLAATQAQPQPFAEAVPAQDP